MTKTTCKILSILAVIGINLGAIPMALFSLFDTQEGTSLFSVDYLLAFSIFLIPNLVSVGLFTFIKKESMKEFYICLGLAFLNAVLVAVAALTFEYVTAIAAIVTISSLVSLFLVLKPQTNTAEKPE